MQELQWGTSPGIMGPRIPVDLPLSMPALPGKTCKHRMFLVLKFKVKLKHTHIHTLESKVYVSKFWVCVWIEQMCTCTEVKGQQQVSSLIILHLITESRPHWFTSWLARAPGCLCWLVSGLHAHLLMLPLQFPTSVTDVCTKPKQSRYFHFSHDQKTSQEVLIWVDLCRRRERYFI